MQASTFTLAFAAAVLLSLATKLWLTTRQMRHVAAHRDKVPDAFTGTVTLQAHRRGADYTLAKGRFGLFATALGSAVLLGWTLLRVIGAKEHGDGVVATVQEVDDRTAAEALKGARIFISRASFPTPEPDEFYWVDLIGLDVVDRQHAVLGPVVGLIETGPHCVLRVQPPAPEAAELLIPFVAAYVDKVDLAGRRIMVDWEADY